MQCNNLDVLFQLLWYTLYILQYLLQYRGAHHSIVQYVAYRFQLLLAS